MRVLLIHNPKSGEGDVSRKELIRIIKQAGHDVEYQSLKNENYDKALDGSFDLVAVAGGDGSVSKLAGKMVGREIPMTILTMGTANNVARTFGLMKPVEELVNGWETGGRTPVDIGLFRGPGGEQYFLEAIGSGLFTRMMTFVDDKRHEHIDRRINQLHGIKGYIHLLRSMLDAYPPHHLSLRLDGEDVSGDYLLWESMNIRCIGPNLTLAPEADPGDGFLDVVLVRDEDKECLYRHLDQHLEQEHVIDCLPVRRARKIEVELSGGDLHVDDRAWTNPDAGELFAEGSYEISLKSGALEFLVPGS